MSIFLYLLALVVMVVLSVIILRAPICRYNKCPACGCSDIRASHMPAGVVVTHRCIALPPEAQCTLDTTFFTEAAACVAWNQRTEDWISERDITRAI